MVPHLVTALRGPINELEQRILESMPVIERWFRLEWMEHTPPIYCSVDLRNAGFKLAPVDSSLFPSSWQNLAPEVLPLAVQAAMAAIEKICPEAKNLLLVPGDALDNSFYRSNLERLKQIFTMAGLNVRLGSLSPDLEQAETHALANGASLTVEPLQRGKRRLGLQHFDPCTILLNHDLAQGVPGILEELHEQFLLPPLHASASTRRMSTHFGLYEELAKRFAKTLGMDHWLIHPAFAATGEVDLGRSTDMEQLQSQVDAVLTKTKRKYKEYGIHEKAFVVLKPDRGMPGFAPMAVKEAKDLPKLIDAWLQKTQANAAIAATHAKGQKARMRTSVEALTQGEWLVQEGVLTHERINEAVAEPVVYTMDRYVVGGFYRIHAERDADEPLHAPGASYVPLAFEADALLPQASSPPGASAPNRFYMYGVMARLAMLAASYELEATDPELADDEE